MAAIEPSLRSNEVARASAKPTESLTAYDLYLRALPHRYALSGRGARKAIEFAEAAVALDPKFATAKALAACCYGMFVHQDWPEPQAAEKASALARSAVEDGWDDPEALRIAGHIGGIARDYDAAVAVLDRALALNSNSFGILMSSAWVRLYAGDYRTAIDHFSRAMRLSPLDPEMYFGWGGLAACHLALKNIQEALAWAEKGRQYYRGWATGFRLLITALVENGRVDEARRTASEYIASFPAFRVSQWLRRAPIKDPEILHRWARSYREAGLPE